ncbi:MAG: polymer-forming cytoskeletal protein, partial [Verrucomicrobiota bacterium]
MAFDVFRKRDEEESENNSGMSPATEKETKEIKRMDSKSGGAYLSEDVECNGTLNFSSSMEFNGRFEGEIHADGPLTIGESALLKAQIHSKSSVMISGKIQGNITAKEKVEISASAQVYGDITAPKVVLKEGAVFVGKTNTQ